MNILVIFHYFISHFRLSSCSRCGIKLNKNDLIFQVNYDTLYHESCFTCYSCGRLLKYGDTYILENQTIQCSLHNHTTTNNSNQSFTMNKTLISTDPITEANQSYNIQSTISTSHNSLNINNKFPNLINFLQSNNSINLFGENNNFHKNVEIIKKNYFPNLLTKSSYQQQNDLSIIYDTTDNNNSSLTSNNENNPQKLFPIIQLCNTNEKNSIENVIIDYSAEQLTPLILSNSNHIDDCQNYLMKRKFFVL